MAVLKCVRQTDKSTEREREREREKERTKRMRESPYCTGKRGSFRIPSKPFPSSKFLFLEYYNSTNSI